MANLDSDRLKEFLHAKRAKRKKQIHPEHSARFNHDMQLQIDCIEWVLEKIEVNKVSNDRLDGLIRRMIKDLEISKDKAMRRPDTDDLWTKIETLQWVLYVIFAIRNERMVVILRKPFGRLMFLGAFAQDVDPIEADVMAIVHYTIA